MKHVFLSFLIVDLMIGQAYAGDNSPGEGQVIYSQGVSQAAPSSDFEMAVAEAGGVVNDLSGSSKIILEEPDCGYVNFYGFEEMPDKKGSDYEGWMEFFDGRGNYFCKRVIVDAQGNSSLMWPKKNLAVDLFEDAWSGDKTTDVTFGDWVKQDGFHLKAYYTDYFRGLGAVAYKLYEDVIADREDMAYSWQRAGVKDADKKARCHPDGFPVTAYLNGKFYGVFSWQLKKHRRNMGQEKKSAEHIHLDGKLDDKFFYGIIDWTQFEIRNPKTLYCMDGSKYDGDHPKEIIDSSSPAFDASNEGHVLSEKVKGYIKNLTTRLPYVWDLELSGEDDETIRQEFSKWFDAQGLIDYTVFSSVTNNVDGWEKNWQWITYDGEKWYVEPYDLDMTFGNTYFGYTLTDPEYQLFYDYPNQRFGYETGPAEYINVYFSQELDQRYAQLRKNGVFSVANIMERVDNWHNRVGDENYAREYEKWSDSYCVQDMVIDDNWMLAENFTNYYDLDDWDANTIYYPGDSCRAFYMVWVAKNEVKGIHPCPHPGYRDSLDRVEDWITRRIAMEDELWNFDSSSLSSVGQPEFLPESSDKIEMIFNIHGQRISGLTKGVNIIKYVDGRTKKVLVK